MLKMHVFMSSTSTHQFRQIVQFLDDGHLVGLRLDIDDRQHILEQLPDIGRTDIEFQRFSVIEKVADEFVQSVNFQLQRRDKRFKSSACPLFSGRYFSLM